MSLPLEFAAPLSPGSVSSLNKNIRKFRIVQYDTGEGMLPMLVGVYQVDPTTGNTISPSTSGPLQPQPNSTYKFLHSVSGTVIQSAAGLKTIRIYRGWVSMSIAGVLTLNLGGASIMNFEIATAANMYFLDFGPWGFSPTDYGDSLGDISFSTSGGANFSFSGFGYVA